MTPNISVPRNPSTTKTGPGRRHVSGHKKTSFKTKRNGKLGTGWMHQRLLRWIAEKNLQKIADRKFIAGIKSKIKRVQQYESAVTFDQTLVPPYPVATVDRDLPVVAQEGSSLGKTLDLTDEGIILDLITVTPGKSTHVIDEMLQEKNIFLSDTQVERRLKKLREAGKIRYDKSAKGWFVVSE